MTILGISSEQVSRAAGQASDGAAPPRRPDAATLLSLYLFLLAAIPSSLVFAPLGAAGGPATLLAVALMIAYLLMRVHPGFSIDRGRQPVRVAGLFFLCSIVIAYAAANLHYLPKTEESGADRGIISAVGWLAVILVAADGIDRLDRLKVLLDRVSTATTGLALIGMAQFFTGVNYTKFIVIPGLTSIQSPTDLIVRGGFNRAVATTAQPLEFAAVMIIAFPLALHQARFAPRAVRSAKWLKVAAIGAAIPMTVSRTALVGLIVAGVVLLPTWTRRHRRYTYAVMLATGAALFVAVPQLLSTFATLMGQIFAGSSSTDSRTSAIGQSLPYLAQHPWFGRGFGTFPPQIYFFTDDQYLNSLITVGAVGLCCLGALFIIGWLIARSLRRRSTDAEIRDLAQCLAAAIAVAAACFGTFDVLSFASAAGLTFLIIGCTGAAWRLCQVKVAAPSSSHGLPEPS